MFKATGTINLLFDAFTEQGTVIHWGPFSYLPGPLRHGRSPSNLRSYSWTRTLIMYWWKPSTLYIPGKRSAAKSLIGKYFQSRNRKYRFHCLQGKRDKLIPWKILATAKGSELKGLSYEQLLPRRSKTVLKNTGDNPGADPFKVITGDFVTTGRWYRYRSHAPAFGRWLPGWTKQPRHFNPRWQAGKICWGVGEFSIRYVKL